MERSTALQGIRVLDFGWAMAGPQGTRILADFGAEVIKVESRARIDLARTQFGPFAPGERTLESCGYFNNFNRGKLSITLNAAKPKGREILRRLIAISDAVLENFSAGVLERWGLSYEEMRTIKPDIVYVSMAGFGHSGPYRDYRSYGPTIQAVSGLTHLAGFPDLEPASFGFSFMDHTGGFYGCMALLLGLFHRMRTGEGQYIDVAQVEAALTLSGVHLLDFVVNGRPSRRIGNRSEHPPMAPHGIYRSAGEDRWVAVACRDERDWARFCEATGHPEWHADPRFSDLAGRLKHQDELDRLVETWTRERTPHEAMAILQAAGVPAGAVQLPCEVIEKDPQTRLHHLFPELEHPQFGVTRYDGMPARLSRTPGGPYRHGPLFGEHNDYVYGELLGMSDDERRELMEEGVIW
jgi:crotonobetainyl-CoA:carnitine CoA-transferase CaiB-like acyl-CoA transferase